MNVRERICFNGFVSIFGYNNVYIYITFTYYMSNTQNWEKVYSEWKEFGKLSDEEGLNYDILPEFLCQRVGNAESVAKLLEDTAFANYLLSKHESLIGALETFINSIIQKLKAVAQNMNGVLFNIEVGVGIHISITFQVDKIQTN